MQNPSNILGYISKNNKVFRKGLTLAMLRSFAVLPLPWLFRIIIDDYIPSHNYTGIIVISVISVGCLLMHFSFAVSGANCIARGVSDCICDIRSRLFNKIQFLSFAYLDTESTGRLLSKYAFDSRKIQDIMLLILNQCLPNLTLGLSTFLVLMVMDWRLAFCVLVSLPFVIVIKEYFYKLLQKENNKVRLAQEELTGNANELFTALRLFKSLGEEDKANDKIQGHNYHFGESIVSMVNASAVFGTFIFVATSIIQLTIVGGGAYLVLTDRLSMGTLFAFIVAMPTILMPIHLIAQLSESYFVGQESYKSICEILETNYIERWKGKTKIQRMVGSIDFDQVTFCYPSKPDKIVLDKFSLNISSGEHIALVGGSGSGKSTVANLILGLYDIAGGEIRIDKHPHRTLDMRDFRQKCAIVMQDNLIISGSVTDNLRIAKADATDEEIIAASRAANAEDFVLQLSDGYDTLLGEKGVNLSGGQRQRISIARAVLRNPQILILDEATSALDNESERLIQEALDQLSEGRTVISIAHRLSTIRNADRIIVMGEGRILEQGTFSELANNSFHFKKLLTGQLEMTEQILKFKTG